AAIGWLFIVLIAACRKALAFCAALSERRSMLATDPGTRGGIKLTAGGGGGRSRRASGSVKSSRLFNHHPRSHSGTRRATASEYDVPGVKTSASRPSKLV